MRLEQCESCPSFKEGACVRTGAPVEKIKGCSLCPSGRRFFRPKSGKEGYRLNVLGKNKG